MKFVIFSPSLRISAIGWCSASVTAELIRTGHEVRVVGTEEAPPAGEPLHDFGHEVLSWRDGREVRQAVDTADGIFYQIGNNFEFHAGALAWLPEQSAKVILHDIYLGHQFWRRSERRRDTATAW